MTPSGLFALAAALLCSVGSVSAASTYRIAVVPKATSHEYWKSINAGAVKAQRELADRGVKVDIIWKGPLREDDRDQQIQVMENFISQRVNGIVLAPLDSKALVNPVSTAMSAKVPVVIMDSGLKTDRYVSFVATDNFKGGVLAGEQMAKLLGGKGNVILLRYQTGSASTEEREAGFLDALKKFPNIKIISSDQHAGATRDTALRAAQNLLNRYGKDTQGIFGPCEPAATGIILALRSNGKAGGAIKVVGFDAATTIVDAMKRGDVQAIIVQNPLRMGYLGVMTLVDHLQGKRVEKRIDTGVWAVTPENMETAEMKELLYPPLEKYLN
ncbi:MAG TPA: substrate-binding domain-containing protein [Candidatus Acidoferrum sp.]|nr:substrate-binding domain-containing protein [Candidatus Acidoferrum sp.]